MEILPVDIGVATLPARKALAEKSAPLQEQIAHGPYMGFSYLASNFWKATDVERDILTQAATNISEANSNTIMGIKMGSKAIKDTATFDQFQWQQKLKNHVTGIQQDIRQLTHLRNLEPSVHLRKKSIAYQESIRTNYPIYQMTDGTIGTSTLYYRVAKDVVTGELNLFWARDPENLSYVEIEESDDVHRARLDHAKEMRIRLSTEDKEKKVIRKFANDEFRYHVATFAPDALAAEITRAIGKHHADVHTLSNTEMTFYTGDTSDIHNEVDRQALRKRPRKVYDSKNDRCAVGVHEMPDNKGWMVKISNPYELGRNKKGFVETDSLNPENKITKMIFSNGKRFKVYKTKEEALANANMVMSQQSQMVWGRENPENIEKPGANQVISVLTDVTTKSYNLVASEGKNPETKKEAAWDAGLALVIAAATRTISMASPYLIAVGVLVSFTGRKGLQITTAVAREAAYRTRPENIRVGKKKIGETWVGQKIGKTWLAKIPTGPKAFHPTRDKNVADFRKNMDRRVNTKPNVRMNDQLDVLNGADLDLTYDTTAQKSPIQRKPEYMEICANGGKAYSREVSQIDNQTATDITFNGLVRLTYKDPDTCAFITYAKYIDAFKINDKIPLSKKVRKLLEGGQIVKITQTKNRETLQAEKVDFKKMETAVSKNLFCGKNNEPEQMSKRMRNKVTKAATGHINWLFNNEACHNLHEANAKKTTVSNDNNEIHTVSQKDTDRAHGSIFPKTVTIADAPATLIEFYKDCVMPIQSYIIRQELKLARMGLKL